MPPFVPLLLNLLVAASLFAAASVRWLVRGRSRRWAMFCALPLVDAGLLAVYVFGEDSYRADGTSRWQAYRSPGGALGGMFVASIVAMAVCAALLAYSGLGGNSRLFRWSALAGSLCSLLLLTATIVGFSAN